MLLAIQFYDLTSTLMNISIEYCYSRLVLLSLLLKWLLLPIRWLAVLDICKSSKSEKSDIVRKAVRDRLNVYTYVELMTTTMAMTEDTTCAVCLNEMQGLDKVWELRNCSHLLHKGCLDTWLDHDERLSCPLCRSPVMNEVQPLRSEAVGPAEPSWAVEKLLYLFGDDLLVSQ